MKLAYYRDPAGNFGDDLNPLLWPSVAPGLLDDDEREVFLGIGTLLNTRFAATLPASAVRHVAGTGYGYGEPVDLDARWRVHFVRGPLTARALGLSPTKAITDPAILVAEIRLPPRVPGRRLAFMPHHRSARASPWGALCSLIGVRYIDPRWSPTRILGELRGVDHLASEAMHGAIVADALRIPWTPVFLHEQVHEEKWHDWAQSLGVRLVPARMQPSLPSRGKWRLRRSRHRLPLALLRVVRALRGEGVLSSESAHDAAKRRVLEAIRRVRPTSPT